MKKENNRKCCNCQGRKWIHWRNVYIDCIHCGGSGVEPKQKQ